MPNHRINRFAKPLFLLGIGAFLVAGFAFILISDRSEASKLTWTEFKRKWEKRGEEFDLSAYIPPEIPAEENLAMHPLFKGLEVEGSQADRWFDQIDPQEIEGYVKKSSHGLKDLVTPADFSEWEGLNENLAQEKRLSKILRRFEPLNGPLDQVAAALRERAEVRFPVNWREGSTMATPHLFTFLRVADAFLIRASLRLQAGKTRAPIDDVASAQRMAWCSGREGHAVAFLIELAIHHATLEFIWQGLNSRSLPEPDLARLASLLGSIESIGERALEVCRTERALTLQLVDQIQYNPRKFSAKAGLSATTTDKSDAWFDANRLAMCQDMQRFLLWRNGKLVRRPNVEGTKRASDAFEERIEEGAPKAALPLALLTFQYAKLVRRALDTEAELTNARIAIALERHRLAHGSYPPDLATLVPDFLRNVPTDLVNNRPVEYRLKADRTPLLYQWGCDGDDDRGTPRSEPMKGDVVWQYSLDQPISPTDYRIGD